MSTKKYFFSVLLLVILSSTFMYVYAKPGNGGGGGGNNGGGHGPPTPTPSPSPAPTNIMIGFGSYPSSGYDGLDEIIAAMISHGANTYRISFTPSYQNGSRLYIPEYVDYYLSHTPDNFFIIVDCNHHYGEGDVDWSAVLERCLDVASRWGDNPRVLIDIINEPPWRYPLYSNVQPIIDAIREAGYTNGIIVNKFDPREQWQTFNDPLDDTYQGFHLYINQYPLDGSGTAGMSWQDILQGALDAGVTKLINAEVGADFREEQYFSKPRVNELNTLLEWSNDRGIGNIVWLRVDAYNLRYYDKKGLVLW